MNIENIQRVNMTGFEAQEIHDVIRMIEDIETEFDNYTRLEIFERFLDHYDRNDGHVDIEIDF